MLLVEKGIYNINYMININDKKITLPQKCAMHFSKIFKTSTVEKDFQNKNE